MTDAFPEDAWGRGLQQAPNELERAASRAVAQLMLFGPFDTAEAIREAADLIGRRVLNEVEPLIREPLERGWRRSNAACIEALNQRDAAEQKLTELRTTVQRLRDGARAEAERMRNPDGSDSQFVAEHRHYEEAFDCVLELMDGSSE